MSHTYHIYFCVVSEALGLPGEHWNVQMFDHKTKTQPQKQKPKLKLKQRQNQKQKQKPKPKSKSKSRRQRTRLKTSRINADNINYM